MKRNPSNRLLRQRRGFTLTEVLLVLAILGVIAAMVIPNLMGSQKKAYERQSRVSIASFEQIAKQYNIDHDGEWPPTVDAMINPGNGSDGRPLAPYLEKVPKDAWNQALNYEYPNSKGGGVTDKPAIWSNGANKQNESGGGDDLNNWQP